MNETFSRVEALVGLATPSWIFGPNVERRFWPCLSGLILIRRPARVRWQVIRTRERRGLRRLDVGLTVPL